MDRFIVIHAVKPGVSQDEAWESCHKLATTSVKGAKWLRSYFVAERDEIICDWEAPDEASIRESIAAADRERLLPIKEVCTAVYFGPEFFK
jgi:hypothetical protein